MNIDEVIKILRNEQTCVKTADSCDRDCAKCPLVIGLDEIIEAYEIAIKLLLQLTRTDEVRTQISAADCISRQAEIDALEERLRANGYGNVALVSELNRSIGYIMRLPSAQPEIIYCKDCKHKPHTSDKYDYDNGDCGFEIIFPDYRCPCRCEDEYYNHIPDDDWYCGNAERRSDETTI